MKNLGYEKHSLFAYKGYPEHSITNAYFYDEDITYNLNHAPFVWNSKYAAWFLNVHALDYKSSDSKN